jgi:transposase
MKVFRAWDPGQELLFPVSPREWLPQDHVVYCVLDLIEELDLTGIERVYQHRDARGEKGYHPAMMTALLLYGYAIGVASSRRLERATYEDVPMRVLTGGQHPDHTRISEFRRQHLCELAELFVQVLRVCQKAGMVTLGHVALDGTKVKANASKHKAMSYERMVKSERELVAEVDALLERAERVDVEEDVRYGRGVRGDELPEELRRREERLVRLRAAKAELEAEAAAEHGARRGDGDDDRFAGGAPSGGGLPRHRVKTTADGRPAAKAQRNFTDPDSRIMKHDGGFLQGYNGQLVVDEGHQVIVAHAMTNQAPDAEHLVPMMDLVERTAGARPRRLTADAGYWSEANAGTCDDRHIDAYIATGRSAHGHASAPLRGRPPKHLDAKGRMSRKVRTKKGRAVYARRKAVVEPCFGQIKGRGFRQLLLRGLDKVRGEWALMATTHNLLKYYRCAWRPA